MLVVDIALKMLWHNKARALITCLAIGVLFFLSLTQVGLLVGWCRTITAIVQNAGADVWIMAPHNTAFDYGSAISKNRIYETKSLPEVGWAAGMFVGWSQWQCPNGQRINVQLVGLNEQLVDGPWKMHDGSVDDLRLPGGVIVDQLFMDKFGVNDIGTEVELYGERATVVGISQGVRTFTAAPFVFTTIERARSYDRRYRSDEVTYVLARARKGVSPEQLRDAVLANLPSVDCLTTDEFAWHSIRYWMLETGVGITVAATAILAFLVSAVVVSQTLYAITQDHLTNYASLLAIGFSLPQLALVILVQALAFGLCGFLMGSFGFSFLSQWSARTTVPLEMTPTVFAAIAIGAMLMCLVASCLSLRSLWNVDPQTVFRS